MREMVSVNVEKLSRNPIPKQNAVKNDFSLRKVVNVVTHPRMVSCSGYSTRIVTNYTVLFQ